MLKKIFTIFDTSFAGAFIFIFLVPVSMFLLDIVYFIFPNQLLKQKTMQWLSANLIAPALLRMLFCRTVIIGRENLSHNKNYIFLSNHASLLDIPILTMAITNRFIFVMDEDLFKIPIIGGLSARLGNLPISRRNPIKIITQLRKIRKVVDEGRSALIFPEGTRSLDGKIQSFKSGVSNLIRQSNVPVIPIAIIGSHELLRRGSFVVTPSRITVRIGEPIKLQLQQSDQGITDQLQAEVSRLFMLGQAK